MKISPFETAKDDCVISPSEFVASNSNFGDAFKIKVSFGKIGMGGWFKCVTDLSKVFGEIISVFVGFYHDCNID